MRDDLLNLYSSATTPVANPNRGWRQIDVRLIGPRAQLTVRTTGGLPASAGLLCPWPPPAIKFPGSCDSQQPIPQSSPLPGCVRLSKEVVRAVELNPHGLATLRIFLPATAFAVLTWRQVCGLDYPFTPAPSRPVRVTKTTGG